MPGRLVVDGGSVGLLDHLALHLHVDLQVDVRGVDVHMPEPVADHVDIVSRPKQMHCGGMPDGVRADTFGLDCRAAMPSGGGVFGGDVADPEAGDRNSIGVKEQMLGLGLFGSALLEVSLQCGDRFRPQGTSAMFSAFA